MNSKHFFSCIALLLLVLVLPEAANASSRGDFRPGYLVMVSNDTIHGLVDQSRNIADLVLFRETGSREVVRYTPDQVREIRMEPGKYYVSRKIERGGEQRQLFLEYLLEGIVHLFYVKIDNTDHYYIEKDGRLTLLTNERRTYIADGQVHNLNSPGVVEGREYALRAAPYWGTLTFLFQEAPEILPDIPNTSFNHRSLIDITSRYHDLVCDDFDCIDYTRVTRLEYYVSPRTGLAGSWFGMAGSSDWLGDFSAVAGLQVRIAHVQSPNWNLLTGIDYISPTSFAGEINVRRGFRGTQTYNAIIDYQVLRIPIAVQYNSGKGRTQPVAMLGLNNVFLLNRSHLMAVRSKYGYDQYVDTVIDSEFKGYQMGFTAGGGLNYRLDYNRNVYLRLDAELRMPFKHSIDRMERQRTIGTFLVFGYEFKM
jgi:hypothetical protein